LDNDAVLRAGCKSKRPQPDKDSPTHKDSQVRLPFPRFSRP
jgi:hypothetical protein